ncbi:nitronate monooxygenase family protein [Bradyrhizobium sp. CCBAU 51765]|uniref:NAD(P)H-dependent flavin oxidoreductase n=1 Tax=Bradyrhizobium sp. CCBAU 51765 TaxID=1325102 RepID=UPI001887E7D9|nr:nitronate monooxygenase [Bradyrhizobium sp. CCBAU 51765]QOZ07580.1 hypothetical protein XH96_08645 [Bradyrhizobium sp. CCBAU 51765]
MSVYPRPIRDLFGIDLPIIQAPMLGIVTTDMVIGVAEAGGLGSLPASALDAEQTRSIVGEIRRRTPKPLNLNFLCHEAPTRDRRREEAWLQRLTRYYRELGLTTEQSASGPPIPVFGSAHCDLLEEISPEVVSFHFGLPPKHLLERVRRTGAKIVSSATIVEEALWLEDSGCDAIIAQGFEAGGHRGTFLHRDPTRQVGLMALVPQIVDAVRVPVIAAGGIADPRGVAAAFALGASGVQVGTAFLFCEEANVSPLYREAARSTPPEQTVITNIFTGRPARVCDTRVVRELGPIGIDMPEFPVPAVPLAPLRAASEGQGRTDFTPLWCGQSARLGRALSAAALTRWLLDGQAEPSFGTIGDLRRKS